MQEVTGQLRATLYVKKVVWSPTAAVATVWS